MNRRGFLRRCAIGVVGVAVGLPVVGALARTTQQKLLTGQVGSLYGCAVYVSQRKEPPVKVDPLMTKWINQKFVKSLEHELIFQRFV